MTMRAMLITVTLESKVRGVVCGVVAAMDGNTHRPPIRKIPMTANRADLGICNLQMGIIGRQSITRSKMIVGMDCASKTES